MSEDYIAKTKMIPLEGERACQAGPTLPLIIGNASNGLIMVYCAVQISQGDLLLHTVAWLVLAS